MYVPNRILKESICTSETIDQLSAFEETFFYRLIVNCDDYGLMDARPAILKSRLFPLKEIRTQQIEDALRKLTSAELVSTYVVDGKPFLKIKKWEKHQQFAGRKTSDYRKWRLQVLKRDGYTCQMCGQTKGVLHVHHKQRYRDNIVARTDVDNGITLCEKCHKLIHRMEGR